MNNDRILILGELNTHTHPCTHAHTKVKTNTDSGSKILFEIQFYSWVFWLSFNEFLSAMDDIEQLKNDLKIKIH